MNKIFQEYKGEYSLLQTTNERKMELISLMQDNLRERRGDNPNPVKCLDGKFYSIESSNVEDLYAIDEMLNYKACSDKMTEISDTLRRQFTSQNKYGPENPYPKK